SCPNHFARLKNALLKQDDARLFVHIDAKSDIGPFRAAASEARVSFIADRADVAWGDFSIVEATLALMTAACHSERDFSHVCLLSGVDYPIRSAEHISGFFRTNQAVEFISLVGMPADHLGKPLSRLTRYRVSPRHFGRLTK
ncbi:beta-1,6-N-acetylglucosaminyltransferase, partial [Roseovarius sp.]|uniref:beta-1,6-N-acetylglucosaminyltransferase n=1 Tax=Roseovarius sp. TaxID=1486281 RepID=UPI0035654014